jgi:hypothetical protein
MTTLMQTRDLPDDPLDDIFKSPGSATLVPAKVPPASYNGGVPEGKTFEQSCAKCSGSGTFRGFSGRSFGPCFKCKGTGKLSFKTTADQRSKARVQRATSTAKKKLATALENLETFKIAEPAVFAWFDGSDYPFAVSMREAVEKWGSLTERQLAAAKQSIERLQQGQAAAKARVDNAPTVNVCALEQAFSKASANAKRAPKLIVAGIKVYPAKADSPNAGALYVRGAEGYLGKIKAGKFMRSRECSDATQAKVLEILADPKGAAIASGKLTGTCAICSRELTDSDSIALGIGPVCAEKFGW